MAAANCELRPDEAILRSHPTSWLSFRLHILFFLFYNTILMLLLPKLVIKKRDRPLCSAASFLVERECVLDRKAVTQGDLGLH